MSQRDFNSKSNDNTIFCTSMCNNRCIMCCQPPQTHNDIKELYSENIQRINKAPKDLSLICLTGQKKEKRSINCYSADTPPSLWAMPASMSA